MRIVGIGAGGHAKVLIDILRLQGQTEIVGLTDRNQQLWGTRVSGVPVLGDDNVLMTLLPDVRGVFIGLGGAGDNSPRRHLYEHAIALGFEIVAAVHPKAIIANDSVLGRGTVVMAGAIVNSGARIGDNVIINTGAIVEHDCEIGNHAHIATGARLAGGVRVGEGAHVGVGASVRQGITLGETAVVGAGAAVVDDVPAGVTVVGVPARPMRSKSY
jgi:UDP-perosamine 4-acetyltransferase